MNIDKETLDILLKDHTTNKNIIFATDSYENYNFYDEITSEDIINEKIKIIPRFYKIIEEKKKRTKKKAEVFTPTWLCNDMLNTVDEEFFGEKNIFNTKNNDKTWTHTANKIKMPNNKSWEEYVLSTRLEITCGEAPFICSRYDTTTGANIPIESRIGILDRKLRIVYENVQKEQWFLWTSNAFQSTYGYEFQGDNVFLARKNLFLTFLEYSDYIGYKPKQDEIKEILNIISWNIWQMDGLHNIIPKDNVTSKTKTIENPQYCRIYNWKARTSLEFREMLKAE